MILSIIIPSYNHKGFVLKTIQAAASIGIRDKEIIVIDDGSTDESPRIIREYIAQQHITADIRLIARENRGLVKTLNEGKTLGRGTYIYGVASDDIPIPEGIEALVDVLEKDSSLQFVLGNALFMSSEDQRRFRLTYEMTHERFFALPPDIRQKEMFLNYPQPILLQATVFRASMLKNMGSSREDLVADDFSLFIRMFSQFKHVGQDFAFRPDIIACFYRQHQTNVSRNVGRQFEIVEQSLIKLCPSEWRNQALFRNFSAHGSEALRTGHIRLFARFLRSTLSRMGLAALLYVLTTEVRSALAKRLSGKQVALARTMIHHESAAMILGKATEGAH